MRALVYRRSIPLYLLNRCLNLVRPRDFYPRISPLGLREIPFSPIKGWVVLKNRLCGICGSDLGLLKGTESFLLEPYGSFPAIMGHEVLAEVVEAPPHSEYRPGERVVVEPSLPCRARGVPLCRFCAEGRYNLCESYTMGNLAPGPVLGYNASAGGGMAEYMSAPVENLFRIPARVADEKAVLADSLASALQPVLDHFPEDGQTVVVYGVGIVGQHILRSLRALGSRCRLVAVARHLFQRDLAWSGGADIVLIDPPRAELGRHLGARLLETTLGGGNLEGGADLFFDCAGNGHSFQEGLLALRGRGTYVLVGTAGRLPPVDISSLWFRELRVTGSMAYAYGEYRGQRVRTYELAVDLLSREDYPCEGLLTHVFPMAEYGAAFQAAMDKRLSRSVKVALDARWNGV